MSAGAFNILWLQAGSCGGCTMSMLEHGASRLVRRAGHASASTCCGIRASARRPGRKRAMFWTASRPGRRRFDALCIEGVDPARPDGNGLLQPSRRHGPQRCSTGRALAPQADYCVAIGSCAAFGGVPAADPDPDRRRRVCNIEGAMAGGALGADYRSRRGLPVINVAGCAPHPGWIMETLAALALGRSRRGRSRRARTAEILRRPSRASRLLRATNSTNSRPAPRPCRSAAA